MFLENINEKLGVGNPINTCCCILVDLSVSWSVYRAVCWRDGRQDTDIFRKRDIEQRAARGQVSEPDSWKQTQRIGCLGRREQKRSAGARETNAANFTISQVRCWSQVWFGGDGTPYELLSPVDFNGSCKLGEKQYSLRVAEQAMGDACSLSLFLHFTIELIRSR